MKFIYFDVANTLLGKPDIFVFFKKILKKHNIEIPLKDIIQNHKICSELIKFPDKTNNEFYHHFNSEVLLSLGIIPTKQILDEIFKSCSYLLWIPFEDTSFLSKTPIKKGILSNWDKSLENKLQEHFNCSFDIILGSEKEGICKPNKAFFKRAIEEAQQFNPTEIFFIGDSLKLDIEPALELGIRAILIDRDNIYPYYNGEKISNLHELKSLIK
jgi:FMN phosphatase YigB (HAD superfamily)